MVLSLRYNGTESLAAVSRRIREQLELSMRERARLAELGRGEPLPEAARLDSLHRDPSSVTAGVPQPPRDAGQADMNWGKAFP